MIYAIAMRQIRGRLGVTFTSCDNVFRAAGKANSLTSVQNWYCVFVFKYTRTGHENGETWKQQY